MLQCIRETDDHSRVKLQSTGEDGSDYINASWIEVRPCIFFSKLLCTSCYRERAEDQECTLQLRVILFHFVLMIMMSFNCDQQLHFSTRCVTCGEWCGNTGSESLS